MRRVRSLLPVLAVVVLLALAAAAAAHSSLWLPEVEPDSPVFAPRQPLPEPPDGAIPPPPLSPEEEPESTGLPWLGDLVVLGWLAGALVVLGLLLRALTRRHRAGSRLRQLQPRLRKHRQQDPAALLAALDEGLTALSDDDADPRRAVIGCWVRLTEAAQAAGVPGYPTDTAEDLVLRLLRAHQVSEPVLAELADVYRLARFTTHEVDESMREAARQALRRLRDQLGVPAGPAGGPGGVQ